MKKYSPVSVSDFAKMAFLAGLFVSGVLLNVASAAALGFPLAWAWNLLVPLTASRLPSIGWWEAFAFLILETIVCSAAKGVQLNAKLRDD